MFLYIQCVINPDTGEATDDLQPPVIKMLKELGSNCTTVSQVIENEDKAVFKAIQDGIDRYNTHHLISNAQKVKIVIIGASLSKPHTSRKDGTSIAFTKVYI